MVRVRFRKLNTLAQVPQYQTQGAAGCDTHAALEASLTVAPMQRVAVPTALSVEIPPGYEIQVRPRSGLSWKQGLTVINAPGTIDSDYRGEIKILMINLGTEPVTVTQGDRIAQFVLQRVEQIEWSEANQLSQSDRAEGGFGSTGGLTPTTNKENIAQS